MSAYTRFAGALMKKGKTMKQAAAAWKNRGTKKKKIVRRIKVKANKSRRTKPKQSSKPVHRSHSMLNGVNKKGALLQFLTLYFGNAFGEAEKVLASNGDKFVLRDAIHHWRTNNPLAFYGYLATVYKYGDCNILSAAGIDDIKIHRKSAAVNIWSLTQWEVMEPLSNAIDKIQKKQSNAAILTELKKVQNAPVPLLATGISIYKWGSPIGVKGVTE